MSVEIRQLRFAVMSADLRSFSRAAARLNVKQATLSRSVLQLEDKLGVKLFGRTTRGAEPTEAGKVFLETARRIITDLDNLQTTARAVGYEGAQVSEFSEHLQTVIDNTSMMPPPGFGRGGGRGGPPRP